MSDANDQYNAIKEKIQGVLATPEFFSSFLAEDIFVSYKITMENIFQDFNEFINDSYTQSSVDLDVLLAVLEKFEKILALQATPPGFKEVLDDSLKCILNWNTNIIKSAAVHARVEICARLVYSQLTMLETINILKSLIQHVDKNVLREKDASSGISRAYIELLGLGE